MKTAPKVQMLVWKAIRGALPVGETLLHRQVQINPLCKRCSELESINHLLFQCEFAERVWKDVPFGKRVDRSGLLDLETDRMRLIEVPCLPQWGSLRDSLRHGSYGPSGQRTTESSSTTNFVLRMK